ncbi:Lon family ATP-dependent protease [Desulfovirgula thermocuniculi]|uniref:Lon family ATP-dependent protease n=1 Tax=Desulfovirgula thermocuniculi TaxID=348842 RepID=UPI0004807AA7|nr:Lon family ATP-dependent protease [Desulfovirgula thermocuniculi]
MRAVKKGSGARARETEHLRRRINALYGLVAELYGTEKLALRAGKLNALHLLRSPGLAKRVLALQRLVLEDPTLEREPSLEEIPAILEHLEERIADALARRAVEAELEKKINERLHRRHEEYLREIKISVLREASGPENAQTLRKLALLEKLEQRKLSRSAIELARPKDLAELVGQERAVKALLAKLASPFPQHVILYGPPGVGKTTAARLALEAAKRMRGTPFAKDAPFVEVNGAALRWDPREVTNPLLGSVHDPIYQGARRDLAESGIPEPKLGLVTEAHGGILFIDEIGEMDPLLQTKLLKVLEDKRVYFDSPYYDPHDPTVPKYVRKLFEEGAPADFILIGATTREPEEINAAIRSRCAEVFFDPLSPQDIQVIVAQAAARLGVRIEDRVPEVISRYTLEGRKAVGILADAFGLAFMRGGRTRGAKITLEDVYEVIRASRLTPCASRRASPHYEVGRIFGLGVMGFTGTVLEIEAVVFPSRTRGQGTLRFNDAAGSMARDAVFNAASLIRRITGEDLANYDVHINVVGGGRVDGPSAGAAVFLAVFSALKEKPLPQDVAVTGELSIRGRIKPVGGVAEKIYGARLAGVRRVFVPAENAADVPAGLCGLEVVPVATVEELMDLVFN